MGFRHLILGDLSRELVVSGEFAHIRLFVAIKKRSENLFRGCNIDILERDILSADDSVPRFGPIAERDDE